ncbi:MAG: FecR domain-containing protein [Verrucomicrobiota bacterium]
MKKLYSPALLLFLSLSVTAQEFSVVDGSGEIGKSPKEYVPAKLSQVYPLGWWARTQQNPLKVEFNPQNIFRLLPRSEVQVSGTGAANSKFRRIIKLNAGQVDLELKNLQGSRVEVETPTAICGAVGTAFTVNADHGHFAIREGTIFANAKKDSGFKAERVSGEFTLAPGPENAYSKINVAGTFSVNGAKVSNGKVHATLAKARGGEGQAALQLHSGSLGGVSSGSYLMNKGTLEPVTDAALKQTHSEYLQATKSEGELNLQKEGLLMRQQVVPDKLEQDLRAAAKRATELRKQLFLRRVIRDTAKENARETLRQQNQRSLRP